MTIQIKGLARFRSSTKSEELSKLKLRLRNGRDVNLYHKSEIKADSMQRRGYCNDKELYNETKGYQFIYHQQYCKIERKVKIFDKDNANNTYTPQKKRFILMCASYEHSLYKSR